MPATASADPGDPFPDDDARVLLSQNNPTGLFVAVQDGGEVTFEPEGPVSSLVYNAIGYHASSGYIYGVHSNRDGANSLLRIGQEGAVTNLGAMSGLIAMLTSIGTGGVLMVASRRRASAQPRHG